MNWQPGMPVIGCPLQSQGMDALRIYLRLPTQTPPGFELAGAVRLLSRVQGEQPETPIRPFDLLSTDRAQWFANILRQGQETPEGQRSEVERHSDGLAFKTPNVQGDRRCAASSRSVQRAKRTGSTAGLGVAAGLLDNWRTMLYSKAYILGAINMDAMTYTTVRANLASTMDRVCNDHEALIITRNGEQAVVMLSLEDFKALEETAYLLRTPANAKRLLSAVAQLNTGKGVERKLTK